MRKFFGIALIVIIFFACLFAGINLAENVAPAQDPNSNLVNYGSANQINLLVLVMDQLDQSPSNFISAWTVIFYYQQPNGLMILPISLPGDENHEVLLDSFHLGNNKFITQQTLSAFQKNLEMKWDGVVMLDLKALQELTYWVSTQSLNLSMEETVADSTEAENLNLLLDPLCTSISQNLNSLENLNWETLYSVHLLSNLPEEKLKSIWTNLSSDNLINCEWVLLE
jgi:hypothetical protein